MTTENKTGNRRDFYRIKDQALVSHLLYDNVPPDLGQFFRHPTYFELMNELQHLDIEFNHLLSCIPEHERTAAALIKLTNKKINMLARAVTLVESNISADDFQLVDISEGGLSFCVDAWMQAGQRMALKFTILPSYLSITSLAEVVSCDTRIDKQPSQKNKSLPYQVRVNFIELDQHQSQLIARHILITQQQDRRGQLARD